MNTTPKTPLVLLADAADELHKLADRLTDAAEELLPSMESSDIYQTEDCANYHDHKPDEAHHCPTIRVLDGPKSDALTFELPKPPTGHMVGGLITEGHAGQRLHADKGAES